MKLLLTTLLLLLSTISFAQPPGGEGGGQGGGKGGPQMPTDAQLETQVSDFAKEAGLTATQESQVLALFKAHFSEMQSKMSAGSRPDRDEMDALKESFKSDISAILTDAQMKIFETQMQKKGNRKQR